MGPIVDTDEMRLRIALRLKAARFLAGQLQESKKGKEAVALPVKDLIKREPLRANRYAVDRIEGYEQMRIVPRPMDLERMAEALEVPAQFFVAESPATLINGGNELGEKLSSLADALSALRVETEARDLEVLRLLGEEQQPKGGSQRPPPP